MSPDQLRHELSAHFQVVKDRSSQDEIVIICPVPGCMDKTGNRSVNVKTLFTHCHRCDDRQPGHVASLFRALGLDWEDPHILEPDEIQRILRGGTVQKPLTPIQDVQLPLGFELLSKNRQSCYWRFCAEMAERKHLTIEDLESIDAGFTRQGVWEPFCIFPVREGPHTVYYQGRTYTDDGFDTTKKFPSKHTVPYGANYWIHGLDDLRDPNVSIIVLVESILNRLTLRKKFQEEGYSNVVPVCIFTHFLSPPQVAKLKRYKNVKEWCFLFDSDSTGMAHKTALRTMAAIQSTVAEMPHGLNEDGTERKTNDANDDVESAMRAIINRRAPDEEQIVMSKLRVRSGTAGFMNKS